MKRLTYQFIFCSLILASLAGCSKSSKKPVTPPVTKPVNPVTTTAICDYNFDDTTLTNHGWTKTFEDNFDGDLSKWNLLQGGVHDELQCNEPANATIVGGALQIKAKQETVTGPKSIGNDTTISFNYTSAWITTKSAPAMAGGATPKVRMVARIRVATGYGLTSLFYGFGGNWPTNGEIDYLQSAGNDTKEYGTNYQYGSQPGVNLVSNAFLYNPTTEDLSTCYHVYTMEWTQNALTSYLDGKLVEVKTSGGHIADLFGKAHTLSLSLPVGGGYYSSLNTANIHEGTMYVDYVKVYTSN